MSLERVKNLDLYKLLDIDRNSDQKSIKRAYRKVSRSCHPDKNPDENTVDLFHQLNDALEVLTVEKYKTEYDKIWQANKEWPHIEVMLLRPAKNQLKRNVVFPLQICLSCLSVGHPVLVFCFGMLKRLTACIFCGES